MRKEGLCGEPHVTAIRMGEKWGEVDFMNFVMYIMNTLEILSNLGQYLTEYRTKYDTKGRERKKKRVSQ